MIPTTGRRAVLYLLLAGAAAASAHAAGFPERPVKLVVPFPPGGLVGAVALAVGNRMGTALGQPVVMDHRPGAAGTIAAGVVAHATRDGYTLLFATSATQGIAKFMSRSLPYDPAEDFSAVGMVGNVTVGLFASQGSGFTSIQQVLAAARAQPGKVNYGSPGIGSVSHLAAQLFESRAGVKLAHVPYAGNSPQMTDLVAGRVPLAFTGLGSGIPYARDGRVRLLAVAARARAKSQPDVPALAELAPGYDAPAWLGIVAPRGTPPEALDKLHQALEAALADREVQKLMDNLGVDPDPMTAADFDRKIRRELSLWEEAVRSAGLAGEARARP